MKPKLHVVLGLCVTVASLLLCSASNSPMVMRSSMEPLTSHSVDEAVEHALVFIEENYNMPGLTRLTWEAGVDNHPDLNYATHHVFINQPEMFSEIQAHFAIDPTHAGFTAQQLTVYVHAPDDQRLSHKITLFDGEEHIVWIGTVDMDGHVTEYMHYE